ELPHFEGKVTTTEFIAKYIHDKLMSKIDNEFNGTLEIVLGESHVAWASYSS
ncbi:MAG: 6-pyruvoyltetrahydropterin/6-carboxytetrahydropterin synthase, partial [Glaciecola sp.]